LLHLPLKGGGRRALARRVGVTDAEVWANQRRLPRARNNDDADGQSGLAPLVATDLRDKVVLTSVDLDRDTQLGTAKGEHAWFGGVLPPKLMGIDLCPSQSAPETALHDRRIAASRRAVSV